MEIKKGIGVSPGVVIGTALVLDAEDLVMPKRLIDPSAVEAEIARLEQALKKSCDQVAEHRDAITSRHGADIGKIFDFHLGILTDAKLIAEWDQEIENERLTTEYAVSMVTPKYTNQFSSIRDRYLSERDKDNHDIE